MTYRTTDSSPDQVHFDGAGLGLSGVSAFIGKDAIAAAVGCAAGWFASVAIEVCKADNGASFADYVLQTTPRAALTFVGIALFHKITVPGQLPRSMQNYHIVIDKSGRMPSNESLRKELKKREPLGTMLSMTALAIAVVAGIASDGITPAVAATLGYAVGRLRWDHIRFQHLYNADRSKRWSVDVTSSAPPLSGNDTSTKDLDTYATSQDDGYQDGGNDMFKAKRPLSVARAALIKAPAV